MTEHENLNDVLPLVVLVIEVFDGGVVAIEELGVLEDDLLVYFDEVVLFDPFVLLSADLQVVQILHVLQVLHCELEHGRVVFELVAPHIEEQQVHVLDLQELFQIIDLIAVQVQEDETGRLSQVVQLRDLVVGHVQELQFGTHCDGL